jgi:hypothetical protein
MKFKNFVDTRVTLTVSVFSDEHDGPVVVTPSGREIALDHENGFSYLDGDFYVSDDCDRLFIYDREFFIEQSINGQFYLQIENDGFTSDNLSELEQELFEWLND